MDKRAFIDPAGFKYLNSIAYLLIHYYARAYENNSEIKFQKKLKQIFRRRSINSWIAANRFFRNA
jgi:hypothetical protein